MVSKKEEDADKLVQRCAVIYDNLPEVIKVNIPVKRSPQGDTASYCKMDFAVNRSKLVGMSQDPNAIRMNTASNILSDEAAFQERAEETFTAMKPSLDGGGHLVMVSTPNGKEFFYRTFMDVAA